jgi:hypothetical protein
MAQDRIERLHYYQGQYLGARDFEDQQAYHLGLRRRHNLGPHTWGLVAGLQLVEIAQEGGGGGVDVFVLPGLAVDGFGREIVVLAPARLGGELFEPFRNQPERYLRVFIAYDEEQAKRPRPGYQSCATEGQFGRVRETFRLLVEPEPPAHEPVVVAGRRPEPGVRPPAVAGDDVSAFLAIPRDASVPHQELPDDEDRPRWLVRLGNVLWDGQKLIPDDADPPLLNQNRSFLGAVAEEVLAPQGRLVLRHRWSHEVLPIKPAPDSPDDPDYGVQAEVQGSLQVDRLLVAKADEQVHGGRLRFHDAAGDYAGVPLTVHRVEVNALGGRDLRLTLGAAAAAENRLAVGPEGVDQFTVAADGLVQAAGDVAIAGELDLTGALDFADGPGDKVILDGDLDADDAKVLGVEPGTLYARSPVRHRWYLNTAADGGGSDAMQLDNNGLRVEGDARLAGDLQLDDQHGDRVVLRGAKGDPNAMTLGTESGTLFAKADQRHRWYIGDNADGGGSDRMALTTSGLSVLGLVNGRNLAADGAKLDDISEEAKNVVLRKGQVSNGALIFPPLGFTVVQCQVILSPASFHPPAFDLNEFGVAAQFGIEAFATPIGNSHWVAQVRWLQVGHGGATGWRTDASIQADYLVIGVK